MSTLTIVICNSYGALITTYIRKDEATAGIKVGITRHRGAAYADDLFFFVTRPEITIPNILQQFESYSNLSNYKINIGKSEVININIPGEREKVIAYSF